VVRLRVALWRARTPTAVGAAVLLALLGARLAAPPAPETVPVVVTATAVAAGEPLDATTLRLARARPGTVPTGAAASLETVVGRTPLVPLPAGLAVVDEVLAGERFAVEPPAGTVVVAVRLADPAVTGLLEPGDRVDLVTAAATDGTQTVAADVVARDALVLDRTTATDDAGPLGLGGSADGAGVLTVVAVPPDDGRRLAAVVGWADLGAVLVG
jgi:Flp pilus assembly protein CpaB